MATQAEGALTRLEHTAAGVSTLMLCRPKKLNSLSLPMIHELRDQYASLNAAGTKCLLLRGEGRALCAGGDVAELRDGALAGNSYPATFFKDEYTLDHSIATLHEREAIAQVAIWDGIVMGGGVGLSVHSPLRVATEKTLFAMPETSIGLFPDVGATWVLSRLSAGYATGCYLGLTSQRIGAADCLTAGLATHYCPSELLPEFEAQLQKLTGDAARDPATIGKVLDNVADGAKPDTAKVVVEPNMEEINKYFAEDVTRVEDVLSLLENASASSAFAKKTLSVLRQKSPTSVKVTFEAIRRHRALSLKEAFSAEYRIANWCMRPQPASDFCEGIRAVLVDKDNSPAWIPQTIEEVSDSRVNEFFAPLPKEHSNGELQL